MSKKKCPLGKEYFENTKKCYKKCKPDYIRNITTNRCRKIRDEKTKKVKKGKKRIIELSNYSISSLKHKEVNDKLPCIINSKIPLYLHQKNVVSHLNNEANRGLIVIHDVGTGKSLTAVTASQCFLSQSEDNIVIVVTPVSLQHNFKETLIKYDVKNTNKYKFYTIQGFVNALKAKKVNDLSNSMLIIDEAHNLRTDQTDETVVNNVTGINTKYIINAAKKVKKVLLLTATPMVNSPYDMINLMAIIDGTNPLTIEEFNKINYKTFIKNKISIYNPSEDFIRENFPRSTYFNVFLKMTPEYYKKYMRVEERPTKEEKTFYNGLRQHSNTYDIELSPSPKVDYIMNVIEKSKKNDKFVVFSHFIKSGLNLVIKRLHKMNISCMHITGSLSKQYREKAVNEFNNDKIKVLLISKAGGEGLDLKNTTGVFVMEPAWNESSIRQVIGRGVRLNSHAKLDKHLRNVDIYRLFIIKPEEETIVNTICDNLWTENEVNNTLLSVDLYMRNVSLKKQIEIDKFMDFMKKNSI